MSTSKNHNSVIRQIVTALDEIAGQKAELAEEEKDIKERAVAQGIPKPVLAEIIRRRKRGLGAQQRIDDAVAELEAELYQPGEGE